MTEDLSRPGAEAIRLAPWVEVRSVTAIPPELLVLLDRAIERRFRGPPDAQGAEHVDEHLVWRLRR